MLVANSYPQKVNIDRSCNKLVQGSQILDMHRKPAQLIDNLATKLDNKTCTSQILGGSVHGKSR